MSDALPLIGLILILGAAVIIGAVLKLIFVVLAIKYGWLFLRWVVRRA